MKNKKGISLISVMVMIVVLGILTIIAIPNVKNVAAKAKISKAKQDNATIQTSIDRYYLKNKSFPIFSEGVNKSVELGVPKRVNLSKLKGPYLNKVPIEGDFYYWVDNEGTVTTSNIDAPTNIDVSDGGLTWDITWNVVDEAKEHSVGFYDENDDFTSLNSKVLTNSLNVNKSDYDLSDKVIVVNSINDDFITPYVSSNYAGNYLGDVEDFATGEFFSIALMSDGTVKAWGANKYGELGHSNGFGTYDDNPSPIDINGLSNIIQVETGYYHVLALTSDGKVYTWGRNNYGQLGNNGADSYAPAEVVGVSNVVQIAAGKYTSLALLEDGSIMSWGRNYYGALGRSDNFKVYTDNPVPAKVLNINNAKSIAAKVYNSYALLEDGTVMSWGSDYDGILGRITPDHDYTPGLVVGLANVEELKAGEQFVLARLNDGTLKAWGLNEFGQLGNPVNAGTTTSNVNPVDVIGINNAEKIYVWRRHAMAILPGGTVMSWGRNKYGQLGYSTNESTENPNDIPQQIPGIDGVRILSDGYGRHTFSIMSDGSVKGWGRNNDNQLDPDSGSQTSTPVDITHIK